MPPWPEMNTAWTAASEEITQVARPQAQTGADEPQQSSGAQKEDVPFEQSNYWR